MLCEKLNYGKSTLSRTQVQSWYNPFKEGREHVSDIARTSHPSTSITDENIEAGKKKILWIIVKSQLNRLLMMSVYRSGYAKHEKCGSEDFSKIVKF